MESDIFIEGERVDLRTVEMEDIDFLKKNINDPKIRKYLDQSSPYNQIREKEFIENTSKSEDQIHFLITDSEDDERLGMISLMDINKTIGKAEIGLWITSEHQEEGFGTEASKLVTKYGFEELRLNRIYARVYDHNPRSISIWEKLDYRKEGILREAGYKDGRFVNLLIYGILKKEWKG